MAEFFLRLWLAGLRELVRLYLRRFPLRDGKGRLYAAVNEKLLPSRRYVTSRIRHGFRLHLDLMEPAQRQIYFFGDYDERHEIALLRQVLRPGDRFFDIGANIGFYTLTASRLVRPGGRVVAFEPASVAWQALTTNLSLNETDNVQSFRIALSDTAGQAQLYRRGEVADGGASLISRADYHDDSEVVATMSLEQFLDRTGALTPNFIKIDVEGLEGKVLAGGQKIFHTQEAPLILIEMNDPAEITAILQEAGYRGLQRHRRRWLPAQSPAMIRARNMFWYRPDSPRHRERLARLEAASGVRLFGI